MQRIPHVAVSDLKNLGERKAMDTAGRARTMDITWDSVLEFFRFTKSVQMNSVAFCFHQNQNSSRNMETAMAAASSASAA